MRALSCAAACLLAVVAAATTRSSDAALTAQGANPSNQLAAASSFERMRVASGTYAGNNTDNRAIAVGFAPDLVIVKRHQSQAAVARSSTFSGDNSKPLGNGNGFGANMIQALSPSGFEVGTQARVNANSGDYTWVAISAAAQTMRLASYTGDGTASRSIAGFGFAPEAVLVLGGEAEVPVLRIAGMSTGFALHGGRGVADSILSLDADGFTVGDADATNGSSDEFHAIAFNEAPGVLDVGSYTGNGSSPRSITGLGLAPALTLIRSSNTSTARAGIWRPGATTGNQSLRFNNEDNDTNAVTALGADGFQLGANADANANSNPYQYLALADEAPG